VVCIAVPADARTVKALNVISPSGQISCHAVKYGGPAIECFAIHLRRIGYLDPYFELKPHGRTIYAERGDYDGYTAPRRKLRYGDEWRRPGVRCSMKTTGLTCRNLDGHGFHMARGDNYRF
jgi:hypothetical protein